MHQLIYFSNTDSNIITQTTKRSFPSDAMDKSLGPLVHICEKRGIIYVTAHFCASVTKDQIKIPTYVEVIDNGITLDIENIKEVSLPEKVTARNHWEFWFQPKNSKDVFGLAKIEVNIDFNEKIVSYNSELVTPIKGLKKIKKITKNINCISEQKAQKKIAKIYKILDSIKFGDPKRGTVFIPPKL
ncbi:hypothetical protein H2O64_17525 [Kordia sp. YSTF-M3]|uniref:Uncharacterized protein n=1 Tax=Kordia aestuariivivens TaxID=2759037 RepID=A0ABR7QDB4_9FLAO|nr:hypothetical protein [Kordia aestuariivivens]MBC8756478.1 hypothetical protein [Kordia aestuariivivens]